MRFHKIISIFFIILLISCKKEVSYNSGNADVDNILNSLVKTERTEAALANITELDLSGLGLNVLPELIDKCTNLTQINLADNEFTEITLKQFAKLNKINLTNNRLSSLTEDFIAKENLKNIQVLNLTNNNFKKVPNLIRSMTNLSALYMSGNELTAVGTELNKLSKLRIANFSKNRISNFDFANRNVQILNIEYNILKELPTAIFTPRLLVLNAGHNRIYKIPDEIVNCTSLNILRLEGNNIWGYPEELNKLAQLKVLNLSECDLKFIPANICKISSLEILYLNHNSLSTIPSVVSNLTNLRQLYLDNNNYKTFHNGLYALADRLRVLSMKNNEISQLPDFIKKFHLCSLDLSGNPITDENLAKVKFSYATTKIFGDSQSKKEIIDE